MRHLVLSLLFLLVACAPSGGPSASQSGAGPSPEPLPVALAVGIPLVPPTAAPAALGTRVVEARVLVGGDVIPHRPSLLEPERVKSALAPLESLFRDADATIVNFESATGPTERKPALQKMQYVASPAWLGALKEAGVDAVTVANNHACDDGNDGVSSTIEATKSAGLIAIGASEEGTPLAAREIVAKDGLRVCALAWSAFVNARKGKCAKNVHLANAPKDVDVLLAVRRAKQTCDAVVAIAHGGDEYEPQTREMRAFARTVAEAGADAVVMHHPHVVSPLEVHHTKDGRAVPLFASVGNLATNQGESWTPSFAPFLREDRHRVSLNGWTRLGMIADLSFGRTGKGSVQTRFGYHLVWIDNEHATNREAKVPTIGVRLLNPAADTAIVERLRRDKDGPLPVFDDACWTLGSRPGCGSPSAS